MQNNTLLSVSVAREKILQGISPLTSEKCSIHSAHNRIVAEDLIALISHPAQAVSAMDGYAARLSDIVTVPTLLPKVGTSRAGCMYEKPLLAGELVRIFTGAVIPDGCDTIVLQEDTEIVQGKIQINEQPKLGQYIRKPGLDFLAGQKIITKLSQLTSRSCALIALAGFSEVNVIKKPQIGILTSGDELVAPGQFPKPGQLINSNNLLLSSLIRSSGGEPFDLGILPDKPGALIEKLTNSTDLDLIVTTGGASVGDHDFIAADIKNDPNTALYFWKIAMRPGKPLLFGKYKNTPLLGLPGNPVSAGVCSVLFLTPIIKKFLGLNPNLSYSNALITQDLTKNDKREEYLRATLFENNEGIRYVTPASIQDSSMLAILNKADCLIQRPAFAPKIKRGSVVSILNFPNLF